MKAHYHNCDGSIEIACTRLNPEIRKMPISKNGGNMLLCYTHYLNEYNYRLLENKRLNYPVFDLPKWEDLEVYKID